MKTSTSSSNIDSAGNEKKALLEVKEKTASSPPLSPDSSIYSSSKQAQFSPKENSNSYDDEETEDVNSSLMRLSKTSCVQGGGKEYHLHSPNSVEVAIDNHPSFEHFEETTNNIDEEVGAVNTQNKQGKQIDVQSTTFQFLFKIIAKF